MSSFLSAISGLSNPTTLAGTASPADLYAKLIAYEQSTCNNGTKVADALDILIAQGVASLAQVPYSDAGCSVPTPFNTFSIYGYNTLDPTDANSLKQYLYTFSVIPMAIVVYPDFEQQVGPSVYTPGDTSCSLGGHCVALVGWDDGRGAFRIQNSWGTNWGDGGYLWIAYDAFSEIVQEAYSAYGSNNLLFSQNVNGIVPGSVTTTGSSSLATAAVGGWANTSNPSTPYTVALAFTLSGPLNVSSVQVQFTAPNTSPLALVNQSVQQWAKGMILAASVTAAEDNELATPGGIFTFTVVGSDVNNLPVTTSCQATLKFFR
jgi:hypothetical protein